jgi:hypothetical protein
MTATVWVPLSWPARGRWKTAGEVVAAARERDDVEIDDDAMKVRASGVEAITLAELDRLVAVLSVRAAA